MSSRMVQTLLTGALLLRGTRDAATRFLFFLPLDFICNQTGEALMLTLREGLGDLFTKDQTESKTALALNANFESYIHISHFQ